ncbi:hypothetical protein [Xanthomonas translucens]|uniref:Lipoprotein n=3 Tax=Xanthomonas campestris pv. translucens TaxID=343 RepID=A0A109HL63_XANCT|nr:hypothetical protein [Xanthomonas translucens]AKK67372.1 hypothetical protein FD63_07730 [Xanthomonas translucens pv. undulosa]AVY67144.1 hypothetical protein NZ30_12665 [Xanthomonas translucens pv. undulosa]ELQ07474.1 hypothetical protein A989_10605 [Xanthomonas translucens DAR61454]KTF35162.1 hypothetical protein OZ12_17200 [Xanthomonas translucens pv. translucens]KWV10596.1 hypothetical protein ATB54_05720 [Xanthomonas translucens]
MRKHMSKTLKVALIGSVLAALVACHRDGDQPTHEQTATPPPAADGSTAPAAGQDAATPPAAGTTGDAAMGSDATQGAQPATPPATDPQQPTSDPQQQPTTDKPQH